MKIRTAVASLAALTLLALATGCSDDTDAGRVEDPASTAETPSSPSPSANPTTYTATVGGHEVTVAAPGLARFRQDLTFPERIHLVPADVVDDAEGERWGDVFVLAPTEVYAPDGKAQPLPADPVAWLRSSPGVKVIRERPVEVAGQQGVSFDVKRKGTKLFGDASGDEEGNGFERYVLAKVDGTWFVVQASTFRDRTGLLEPDEQDDVVMPLLRDLEVAPGS